MASDPISRKAFIDSSIAIARSYNFHGLDLDWEFPSSTTDMANLGHLFTEWRAAIVEPPSPLYNPTSKISGDSGIMAWIQAGLAADKILFGFPYYGFAWSLVDPDDHGIFAPANGTPIAITVGALGYNQIRKIIKRSSAKTVFNCTIVTDYCYFRNNVWIAYDDTKSISAKVSYAKAKGLRGYFAWNVAFDFKWVLSQTASRAWKA
ncbi:hypothetical protein TIFTF001_034390 [Ficus carica]|uniref:GH18 domain-containing protein n=1 Tax=Ficus carica TaxID=3494 RepID=A0AA88JAJ1_FICCA|nr:hypothetical protein TIFTF001_034390 [Ficus carica]